MAGFIVGYNAPYRSTGNEALDKKYRSDAGAYLTDSEYATYQQQAYNQRKQQEEDEQAALRSRQSVADQDYSNRMRDTWTEIGLSQMFPDTYGPGLMGGARATSRASAGASAGGGKEYGTSVGNAKDILSSIQGAIPGPVKRATGPNGLDAKESAARDAAYARAKDQAGATARASVAALQDVIAGSGMTGSTVEAAGVGGIIGQARNNVGDFTARQLTEDLQRAEEVSDQDFAAQVSQRNASVGLTPSLLGLIAARGLY